MDQVRPGDRVSVRALKSDGHAYRWWDETVEAVDAEKVVTVLGPGREVHGFRGSGVTSFYSRTTYWFSRPHVLMESYNPSGHLLQIYVHISSFSSLGDRVLTYTDHELDVVLKPGQPPEVVDEDEFAEAAVLYGYSSEFQSSCYRAVEAALDLILAWEPSGIPILE